MAGVFKVCQTDSHRNLILALVRFIKLLSFLKKYMSNLYVIKGKSIPDKAYLRFWQWFFHILFQSNNKLPNSLCYQMQREKPAGNSAFNSIFTHSKNTQTLKVFKTQNTITHNITSTKICNTSLDEMFFMFLISCLESMTMRSINTYWLISNWYVHNCPTFYV